MMTSNRIEQSMELTAPVSRVWRALTDQREFGEWFGVALEGPLAPGKSVRGKLTTPGYEQLQFEVAVQKMAPERLFSYTWHPYAIDPNMDYSQETPTLVEFTLERTAGGTLLVVTEIGFDALPDVRRDEAYQMHVDGWAEQMDNIRSYLARSS